MFFSDVCYLIKNKAEKNIYGATKVTESSRMVFCNKKSLGMTENYELNRLGYKGELKLEIMIIDFNGEEEVIYNSKKYKIQRTFERDDEIVELICVKVMQ